MLIYTCTLYCIMYVFGFRLGETQFTYTIYIHASCVLSYSIDEVFSYACLCVLENLSSNQWSLQPYEFNVHFFDICVLCH